MEDVRIQIGFRRVVDAAISKDTPLVTDGLRVSSRDKPIPFKIVANPHSELLVQWTR
jgi:hypothetical protein